MKYYKQIDALRLYSVAWVVVGHIPFLTLPHSVHNFFTYFPGVQLFFCISGFLISNIILENNHYEAKYFFKSFYARRFLRIFPIYYLAILFLVIFNVENYLNTWLFYDALYISNIRLGIQGGFDQNLVSPHFWSLAVEEQFYLLWPGILFLCKKKNTAYVITSVLLVIAAVFLFFFNSFLVMRTIGNVCYLGTGCMISLLLYYNMELVQSRLKLINYTFVLCMGSIFLISFLKIHLIEEINLLITTLVIPIILLKFIIGFQNRFIKSFVESQLIVYFGKISYGIYIYHMFALYPMLLIQKYTGTTLFDKPLFASIFKIVVTLLISILSWEYFEKKLNKLKNNYKYNLNQTIV